MESKVGKKKLVDRFLDGIERAGNKLPDPVTLFVILAFFVLALSLILSKLGVSAVKPGTDETIEVINLLNREGLIQIVTNMVSNFTGFAPLGIVVVTMIGIGVAENSGLISALMKKTVLSAPKKIILPVILFTGLVGNVAADAAFIILPPIAAMIFMSVGRNPLVGLIATYAAIAGGSVQILLFRL